MKNFFNNLKNPVDDETIFRILETCFEACVVSNAEYFIYKKITNINKSNRKCIEDIKSDLEIKEYEKSKHRYFIYIFDKWKESIINKNINDISKKYRNNFHNLQKKLKNIDFSDGIKANSWVKELMKKDEFKEIMRVHSYRKSSDSYWTHVRSHLISAHSKFTIKDEIKNEDVTHRLYFNVDAIYVYEFALQYMKKCEKYNIPFHYKYNDEAFKDDVMVIYTTDEYLIDNIKILEEIKKENKNISKYFHKPTILSDVYDGWIGYGSESSKELKEKYEECQSFNYLRANVIKEVIEEFYLELPKIFKENNIIIDGDIYKDPTPLILASTVDLMNRYYNNNEVEINKIIEEIKLNKDKILKNLKTPVKCVKIGSTFSHFYLNYGRLFQIKIQIILNLSNSNVIRNIIKEKIKEKGIKYGISVDNFCISEEVLKSTNYVIGKDFEDRKINREFKKLEDLAFNYCCRHDTNGEIFLINNSRTQFSYDKDLINKYKFARILRCALEDPIGIIYDTVDVDETINEAVFTEENNGNFKKIITAIKNQLLLNGKIETKKIVNDFYDDDNISDDAIISIFANEFAIKSLEEYFSKLYPEFDRDKIKIEPLKINYDNNYDKGYSYIKNK